MKSGGVRMLAPVMVSALLLANCAADTLEEPEPVSSEGEEDRPAVETNDDYSHPVGVGRASPPEGEFIDVSVSSRTSCGVRVDGSLVCWGDFFGEPPGGEFTAVSVDEEVACALRADGSPVCWGAEWRDGLAESGLLEPPAGEFVDVSVYPRSLTGCGVRVDGSLVCWGGWHYGQLNVPGGEFTEVVAGPRLCALSVAGGLACWGDPDNKGLLYAPQGVFQSVSSASFGYACAVRDSGELVCWGANPPDGDGPPGGEFTEVSVAGAGMCALTVGGDAVCWGTGRPELDTVRAGPFTQISASGGIVCALRTSGEAECWGNRTWYEGGKYLERPGDWELPAGRFTQVAAYSRHQSDPYAYACGIRADTTIACWNYGIPATPFELVPAPQESPQTTGPALGAGFAASGEWVQPGTVSLDWDDVAGASGYDLWHWYEGGPVTGWVGGGQASSASYFGLAEHPDRYWFAVRARNEQGVSEWSASFSVAVPLSAAPRRLWGYSSYNWLVYDLPAETGFASVAVAGDDACALRIDSTVVCWGATDANTFVDVDADSILSFEYADSILSPTGEFTQIAAVDPLDYGYFCGLRADTSVTCWSSYNRALRVSFEHENRTIGLARLGSGFCSIDTKGQVVCWEHAYFDEPPQWAGQLADAAVGPTSACGIRQTDSTLACWDTASGEPADTPQGPFSDIDASVGGGFCAVTADGALTCWNTDKLLEDPPIGEFTELAVGAEHACAIRSDNTLACWGDDGEWESVDGYDDA